MLKFTRPANLRKSLVEAYEYLQPSLENVLGYPVRLKSFSKRQSPKKASEWQSDGSLLIRLPGPKDEVGRTYLCLSKAAANDEYCRQIAARFVRLCADISRDAKQSWDVKAKLIREEQFLWDNAVLSQIYAGNQKYNALDLVGAAREASIFRYEGDPVRLGLLATWNWYKLKPKLEKQGCTVLSFDSPFDLRGRLRADKASHLLADGCRSFFAINPKGAVFAWITLNEDLQIRAPRGWQTVPSAYHSVPSILTGRDLALAVNGHGETLLFNRELVLKWNRSGWHRVTGPPVSDLLKGYVSAAVAKRIIDVALELSEQRKGALIVVSKNCDKVLSGASKGGGSRFKDSPLFHFEAVGTETISRLASIDGAMVIDDSGCVRNAGVILEVPEEFTASGEGARTAAASFASSYGIAIKVSHDGPISVYQDSKEVRRIG